MKSLECIENEVREEYTNNDALILNEYYKKMLENPIRKNTVLMEVRDGQSFTGNVRALYLGMINDPRFKEWKIYISYKETVDLEKIKKRLPNHHDTYWIEHRSKKYMESLATCEYIVTSSTYPSFFIKRKGQIYINTWHGTPLKHMGRDLPGIKDNQNVLRNFLMTDYLLSPNPHTTKLFKNRYQLEGLYEGVILEGGYPRIDMTYQTKKSKIFQYSNELGLTVDPLKKTVLYTPTWRGQSVGNPECSLGDLEAEVIALKEKLSEWNLLLKVHPFIADIANQSSLLKDILIPDTEDINEWLVVADILVTDYSSVFFDYLVTDCPIIFYCPDALNYKENRGLYFNEEELPGPVVMNFDDLILAIHQQEKNNVYQSMKEKMVLYDDGHVTQRYIETIFFNQSNVKSITCKTDKKNLLLYAGGMKNNGITTALLNLCHTLDEKKYDITLFLGGRISKESEMNIRRLPERVRLMFHLGYPIYDRIERFQDKILTKIPTKENYEKYFGGLEKAYQREANRLFPNIHFDVAIDFSGYASFWAKYILFSQAKRHLVYLHNDIMSEIELREQHRINLQGMTSLYRYFDALVNVSSSLKEVNAKKLKSIVSPKKHVVATNLLDVDFVSHHSLSKQNILSWNGYLVEKTEYFTVVEKCQLFLQKDPFSQEIKSVEVSERDTIKSQSIYYYQGIRYLRIQINGIEYGWMPEDNRLLKVGIPILEKKEIECEGRVLPNRGLVYGFSTPSNISMVSAGSLTRLHNATVMVHNELKTEQGNFYTITSGNWKGTIKTTDVQLYQKGTHVIGNGVPFISQKVSRFLKVVDQNAILYSALKGLSNTKEIGMAQEIMDEYLYNYWEMENHYGKFYQYRTKNNKVGWIDAKAVKIIETPFIPIRQKENYLHEVNGDEVLVFDSEEDIKNNNMKWMSHLDCVLQVHEKLWTQCGIFYKVSGEYNGFIEERAVGGRIIEHRFKDINNQFIYLKENRHHYMTMGRLSHEKNHAMLIKGFGMWLKENPSLKDSVDLSILGDGPLKDELLNLIKELDLQDNVYLLGHRSNTADLLKECYAFIFPSLYEGQGLALIEAMMMGITVAATDIPVLNQVLGNGKYGYLISGTDEQSLKETFVHLENNSNTYEKFDVIDYQTKTLSEIKHIFFPTTFDKIKQLFR